VTIDLDLANCLMEGLLHTGDDVDMFAIGHTDDDEHIHVVNLERSPGELITVTSQVSALDAAVDVAREVLQRRRDESVEASRVVPEA